LKVYAVEPASLAGHLRRRTRSPPDPGHWCWLHPKEPDTDLLDGVIQVDAEPAREMARRSAREEGMLVGISSGATLARLRRNCPACPAGATVLGFNYDTGERYLSIEGFLPA
jgi:cysteine synthase A